jgi:hypothetical protein
VGGAEVTAGGKLLYVIDPTVSLEQDP